MDSTLEMEKPRIERLDNTEDDSNYSVFCY